jgi:hypothetical protein
MFRQREDGSEVEKDFIKKQIQQLVQALQRVLHLATEEQRHDAAEDALQAAARAALKLDLKFLAPVSPDSCAMILGTGEKLRSYARIVATQAQLLHLRGQELAYREQLLRALKLHEAALRVSAPSEEDQLAMASLRSQLSGQ